MTIKIAEQAINTHALMKQIRKKISKNEYYICSRMKNELFKRKFNFTKKSDFSKILLLLNEQDFLKIENENQSNTYGTGIVCIFLKKYNLYDIHSEKEEVELYIKIKIPNKEMDYPVISFHESEY